MRPFSYFRPANLTEAKALLKELKSPKILAGGTDLVIQLRKGEINPENIVDITGVAELGEIIVEEEQVLIGSMVTFQQVASHPIIKDELACLAQACALVGSPQIRNQGTIGGNIINASPAADSVPALVALGARVRIEQQDKQWEAGVTDILTGVGKTSLTSEQVLTNITIPRTHPKQISSFTKLARRNALAIARMSMAGCVQMDMNNLVKYATISLGAVGPNPYRVPEVESFLIGKELSPQVVEEAAQQLAILVKEKLGQRPSAVYKNVAILGIARETLNKLANNVVGG